MGRVEEGERTPHRGWLALLLLGCFLTAVAAAVLGLWLVWGSLAA